MRGRLAASGFNVYRKPSNFDKDTPESLDKMWELINGDRNDEFGLQIETAKEKMLGTVKEYLE